MKPVYRDGKVHVVAEQCSTCILRPGNLMQLQPGAVKDMITSNLDLDSAYACHQTLGQAEALCRAYVERYGEQVTAIQLARAMGLLTDQALDPEHP